MRHKKRFSIDNNHQANKVIALNETQQKEIKEADLALAVQKQTVADLALEVSQAKANLDQGLEQVKKLQADLLAKASQVAQSFGIDINNPANGTWNLDTRTMTLNKVT